MKATFAIGLLAASVAAQAGPGPDFILGSVGAAEVVELIDGVLIGAFETEGIVNLDLCVTDFNPLVTDMSKAVADFEDGSFHAVADGIYQLG